MQGVYTFFSFAKNKSMKKSTKILIVLYIAILIPSLIMGKSIFAGIKPNDTGFAFDFNVEGIIAIILNIISIILGMILFFRFVMSQPIDKAIFFSSLPLIVIYGLLMFLIADINSFNNPTANSLKTLLNISSDNAYNTILWAVLITIIFVLLLFLNYFLLCKPINRVEKVVSRLGDGKVRDEKLKIGGGKQFNSIEHSLNKINNNYRSKDNSLRSVNLEAQKFIPKEFFKFLGKSSISELELGGKVKKNATTMSVKLVGINNNENMTLEENFNFLNSYIHVISPLIRKFGGFIDKYLGEGILAVFAKAEDAIDCSHAVVRAISVKNRQNKTLPNVTERIVISSGEVIFGIVGEEERKMPTIISDIMPNLEKLDQICKIMFAKVVFTKSTLDNLPLSYKFLYRHIGKLNISEDKEIVIFEDFDAMPRDISSLLIKSKSTFERGIILYEEGNYQDAIDCFSQVLKINPNDRGCYLYYNRTKEKLS